MFLAAREAEEIGVEKVFDTRSLCSLHQTTADDIRIHSEILRTECEFTAHVGGEELGAGILEDRGDFATGHVQR